MILKSREEMLAYIANGTGVMLPNGQVVTTAEEIPSELELAKWEVRVAQKAVRNVPTEMGPDQTTVPNPVLLERAEQALAEAHQREKDARDKVKAEIGKLQKELPEEKPAPEPEKTKLGQHPTRGHR